MGYKFVQVRVESEAEFNLAFAHFASKGYNQDRGDGLDGATELERTYGGPGYVKYNEMLGYTWYSSMDLSCIVTDSQYAGPLFFKDVQGFMENF